MAKDARPVPWRLRIVGYGEVVPDQVLANEKNWRGHPRGQQDALAGVLSEVGIVQNIIINKRTSEQWPDGERGVETLVDGHARVALALRADQPTVPVTYVDLTPAEENEVLATLDPLLAMAFADKEKLDELLKEVSSGDAAVMQMLAKLAADEGITKFDPSDEWNGMPEFENEDAFGALHTIKVHFAKQEDIDAFARLIEQAVTNKTQFIWYPKQERENLKAYNAHDES
jgi:hypothetical protein